MVNAEYFLQVPARIRLRAVRHFFRRALGHDVAAALAAFRAQVDHPVACLDDVEIVRSPARCRRFRSSGERP